MTDAQWDVFALISPVLLPLLGGLIVTYFTFRTKGKRRGRKAKT